MMAKAKIGATINTVSVEYGKDADAEVEQSLITLLKACIKADIAAKRTLSKIYIGYTTNGTHAAHSRHKTGQAVDISRINGKYMSTSYTSDDEVKEIVNAIQDAADKAAGIRAEFRPPFQTQDRKGLQGGRPQRPHSPFGELTAPQKPITKGWGSRRRT